MKYSVQFYNILFTWLKDIRALSGAQIQATVMTSVAMQLDYNSSSTTVSVMTNLYSEKERILVFVNDALLSFSSPSQYWQIFPGSICLYGTTGYQYDYLHRYQY